MGASQAKSEFLEDFIERTAQAREAAGYSQSEMAHILEAGMSQDKYKQYESRSFLPMHLIERFCLACRVDLNWLVTGRGTAPVAMQARRPKTKRKTAKAA